MSLRTRLSLALGLAAALAAPAVHAQSLYFLEGDDRPVAPGNITPTSSFRVPPTQTGTRGFFHWDLREWANCTVPYAITQAATGDASTTPADARIAINNAFDTWEAVSPALIAFSRQINSATATAGLDNENLMLWDGGNAANLLALGAPGSGTLALTFIFYDARCRIRESDILYNDADYQWRNGNNSFSIYTRSAATPTFALANGQTLTLRINGGAVQTVTFNAANFANIAAATQAEVRNEINAQLVGGSSLLLADGTIGIRSNRVIYDGGTSIEITGGTANGVLGWPAALQLSKGVDVQSIALHETGHFLGIHHTSQDDPEPNPILANAVMFWLSPDGTNRRALAPNDIQALNFLYTPDLGDAPDALVGGNPSAMYQSRVHTSIAQAGAAGMLNGVQRYLPATGPVHLFGFRGPNIAAGGGNPAQNYSLDRFEWLGADMDDNAAECEALLTNADADDGATLVKMTKGKKTRIRVTVSTTNRAGRYALNANQRLNMNGYLDFNLDHQFTSPADLQLWWAGIPAATVAGGTMTSKNFVPALSDLSVNPMVLVFDVPVPANAPDDTWARFRLDYGEDEGRNAALSVGGWEGNLAPAIGEAQFGEAEDYPAESVAQRLVFSCPPDTTLPAGTAGTRRFCVGNAGAILDEFCWTISDRQGWITGSVPALTGNALIPPDENVCVAVDVEPPIDCYDGEPDSVCFMVWPCDDPAAVDTCYAIVHCAHATPALVSNFVASAGTDYVDLTYWLAEDGDVSGVNVERAELEAGPYVTLTSAPIPVDGRTRYQYTDRSVAPGTEYRYRLALVRRDGTTGGVASLRVSTQRATFALGRPHPNPTAAGFELELSLPKAGHASLRVFDISGRRVSTIFSGTLTAGEHPMTWSGRGEGGGTVANGLYYVVFEAAGKRATQRVVVMR